MRTDGRTEGKGWTDMTKLTGTFRDYSKRALKKKQQNTRAKKTLLSSINLLNVWPQFGRYQKVSRGRVKTVTSLSAHRARSVGSYARSPNCGNQLLASSCLSPLLYIPTEHLSSQRTDLHEI